MTLTEEMIKLRDRVVLDVEIKNNFNCSMIRMSLNRMKLNRIIVIIVMMIIITKMIMIIIQMKMEAKVRMLMVLLTLIKKNFKMKVCIIYIVIDI